MSEDGAAWIVDANDGSIEGPWSNGSPPVAGPFASDSGARVRFRDGEGSPVIHKAERVAMEEVRRGLVSYDVPAARAGIAGADGEA